MSEYTPVTFNELFKDLWAKLTNVVSDVSIDLPQFARPIKVEFLELKLRGSGVYSFRFKVKNPSGRIMELIRTHNIVSGENYFTLKTQGFEFNSGFRLDEISLTNVAMYGYSAFNGQPDKNGEMRAPLNEMHMNRQIELLVQLDILMMTYLQR